MCTYRRRRPTVRSTRHMPAMEVVMRGYEWILAVLTVAVMRGCRPVMRERVLKGALRRGCHCIVVGCQ
eukprot:2433173-Prymnesium_polylepis.1